MLPTKSAPINFRVLRLGMALQQNPRDQQARAHAQQMLAAEPDNTHLLHWLGVAECRQGNPSEGIKHFQRLLALEPARADVLLLLATAWLDLSLPEEASHCLTAAYAIQPDIDWLAGNRLHALMHLNDWTDFDSNLAELAAAIANGSNCTAPLIMHALLDSAALQAKCAINFSNRLCPPDPQVQQPGPYPRGKRIRLGYFSSDFWNHPVSLLSVSMLEAHDRSRFEVFGFSLETVDDSWRQRMRAAFDHFIDVKHLTETGIAQLARSMQIDIAIDLNGHTRGSRPLIFANRAAPLQVSYLGFLGTMGVSYIDYLMADNVLVPASSRQHYSEKIAYLPSYQCNQLHPLVSPTVFTRASCGLPDEGFVYCCFNNNYKLTPDMFAAWIQILQEVAGSVLWLFCNTAQARKNLAAAALQAGIDPARLVFAPRVPHDQHLARLPLADTFLDTFPYNAGATASDALRVGLPLVTRCGNTFASRMGASLLTAAGIPELITDDIGGYKALAIRLGTEPDFHRHIKDTLRNKLATCDLFNTVKSTRNIEAVYTAMYELQQQGHLPGHIVVNNR